MKIIFARGQTANQFWIYTNFIADALETKQKIAIWSPDITIADFPNFFKASFINFPLYFPKLAILIGYKRYINIVQTIFCNKYSLFFLNFFFKFLSPHEFIIADTLVKKSIFRSKHLQELRQIFTPDQKIVIFVNSFLGKIRKENQILIGLHIRYGDYRLFENGKYFYSLAQYRAILDQLKSLFDGKELIFFIASSEEIEFSSFDTLNYSILANTSAVKDLYCLSKVDYLVGPPSTFSAWASLYGNVPIYFIEEIEKKIEVDDFVLIQDVWF